MPGYASISVFFILGMLGWVFSFVYLVGFFFFPSFGFFTTSIAFPSVWIAFSPNVMARFLSSLMFQVKCHLLKDEAFDDLPPLITNHPYNLLCFLHGTRHYLMISNWLLYRVYCLFHSNSVSSVKAILFVLSVFVPRLRQWWAHHIT